MDVSSLPQNPIKALEAKVPAETQKKLLDSSKQYESVFMAEMFNIMFKDVDMNPMGSGSSAADDTYKGMLTQKYADAISQGPGIGIAQPIYKALLEAQIASQETK